MDHPVLHIQMFGKFSLRWGDAELNDSDNRMKKVWLLLAYLIYRRTAVSPDEVAALLWEGDDAPENTSGALKTMFYRARTLLNKLGKDAGQTLILRKDSGYIWNPDIPMELDLEQVDTLCRKAGATQDEEECFTLQRQLLSLYEGDFLPKLSSESWVIPISTYYHRLYLETASSVLLQLERRELWAESAALSASALKTEPYSEELYCHLIRAQLAQGDPAAATASYETMSELLFSHFGVMPSDEARALYRLATRAGTTGVTHAASARDLLREEQPPQGAMFCEYDFFRVLYQAQARAIGRSGDTIHIALFTLSGRRGKQLPRRSLDIAAENFKQILIANLRQGDIVTQCSSTQFLIMLPQANYENSCLVSDRLIRAFARQYPHSPADIHFSVQPLEPAEGSLRR